MGRTRLVILHYQFGCGGAEHMVAELASHIDPKRFDVKVVCVYGSSLGNEMERTVELSGGRIIYLGFQAGDSHAAGVKSVWGCLESLNPDVIHTHLGAVQYCLPWAIVHHVRIVHTIHNIPEIEASNRLMAKAMKWMYSTRRAIPVAISKQNRLLTARYYELPEDRVELINNPVDTTFYRPTNSDDKVSVEFDFVNVAGLRPQKNQKLLLRAFRNVLNKYPSARLCIVGDGSERARLEADAKQLGIEQAVTFAGQVSERSLLRRILWASRCFILSSDFEGLPLSALEAMSCGLPVVSTNVGGMSDIVCENGFLIPPGDEAALSEAMCKVLDGGVNSNSKETSRLVAKGFDVAACTIKYESVYDRCVEK